MKILEQVYNASVFSILRNEGDNFTVVEECDCNFEINLNWEELLRLSEELKEIALGQRKVKTYKERFATAKELSK